MKASINCQTITITGKLKEESKIKSIIARMSKEISSLCIMEVLVDEMVEITACYDSFEATVQTVKESYSCAKSGRV